MLFLTAANETNATNAEIIAISAPHAYSGATNWLTGVVVEATEAMLVVVSPANWAMIS